MIDQLLETLKTQRKEVLAYLMLKLMESGKLAFSDIVEAHVKHIEMLERLQSEELMKLRGKLSVLWCDHKKNVGKHITSLMQDGHDKGWLNITQEQIDNSKWNK